MLVALVGLPGSAGATTPAAGFAVEAVRSLPFVVDIDHLPDGRLITASKSGQIHVMQPDGTGLVAALDLSSKTCQEDERGLQSVTVDPGYPTRPFIYVYYTGKNRGGNCPKYNGGVLGFPDNRVARFTLNAAGVGDLASELQLIKGIPNVGGIHNGGDVAFGKDGWLYATSGDGGCDYASTQSCGDTNDAAQDRNTLLGKIIRITRDGAIPSGNPAGVRCNTGNANAGQICQEAFARGLRNPWRMAHDPNATGTKVYVNDVGSVTWEEINQLAANANFGWNMREGNCARGSSTNCGAVSGLTNPIYAYKHVSGGCNSIVGGAFVPATGSWPAPYAGSYVYGDFTCGHFYRLVPKSGGGFTTELLLDEDAPVAAAHFAGAPGGQALYYSALGVGIMRLRHVGAVNRAPSATLSASPTSGTAPLNVVFNAGGSDPDGDALTLTFDPGDGSGPRTVSAGSFTHTYDTAGEYTASLVATDPGGLQSQPVTQTIHPGSGAPDVQLVVPASTFRFAVAQEFQIQIAATDPDEGPLPDSALTLEVRRFHTDHYHPFYGPATGGTATVQAPAPEDLVSNKTSWLEVRATATDSTGTSTTEVFNILPAVFGVTFMSSRQVQMTVNGVVFTTDKSFYTWAGHRLHVTAPDKAGVLHPFSHWGDYPDGSIGPDRWITMPARSSSYKAWYK